MGIFGIEFGYKVGGIIVSLFAPRLSSASFLLQTLLDLINLLEIPSPDFVQLVFVARRLSANLLYSFHL